LLFWLWFWKQCSTLVIL